MIGISEVVSYYITNTFQQKTIREIYSSFGLLELFGSLYYEDKYVTLIATAENMDRVTVQDTFLTLIKKDILDVISEHQVTVELSSEPTLSELNEIAHVIHLLEVIDDYDSLSYIINSDNTPRMKFIELLKLYSKLEEYRSMELIEDVPEGFIEALRRYIEYKITEQTVTPDEKHRKAILSFFAFANMDTLGKTLYEDGYTDLTLDELVKLCRVNIFKRINDTLRTGYDLPMTALTILSILMVCKDTYQIPLLAFANNSNLFLEDSDDVLRVSDVMTKMLADYTIFIEAQKAKEVNHVN